MQINRDIGLQITTDSTATTVLFDNTSAPQNGPITRMQNAETGLIYFTAAGGSLRLSFGNIEQGMGCYVYLNADATLTVDGHDFAMACGQQGTGFWEYASDAAVSSLIVTLPAGQSAQGSYSVWGDAIKDAEDAPIVTSTVVTTP